MTEQWFKPGEGWPTTQDPARIEARLKDGRTVSAWIMWDFTDQGDPICSFEIDGDGFCEPDQVEEYRPLSD